MHTNCTKYIIFYAHHSCKEKQSVKQRNGPISGPIRSDPVIRPDPVNTRTRPCGTIFSNVDFSQCRLSASNVKIPQMYLRDLVFDTVNRLLWYVLISNSAEKATSSGKVLS